MIARSLYQVYFCLLGICFFVLSTISVAYFNESLDKYELIIENWKQEPISSMRVTYDQCDPDEEELLAYNWPGTKNGCDCRNIYRLLTRTHHGIFIPSRKIYNTHACNITQEIYGCTSIYAVKDRQFKLFPVPNGEYGYELCVKREKGNSFYENPPQKSKCPSGQKQCGTDIDSYLCISGDQCPINSYSIETSTDQLNDNTTTKMKNGYVLKINRNNGQNQIISQTKISEGGICVNYHNTAISTGREDYTLMKNKRKECEHDDSFKEHYTVSEYDFYKVNQALDLENLLPGFQISQKYRWGIYSRGYILWKMQCRGQIMEDFKNSDKQLNKIYDSQVDLLTCSTIFICVIVFTFSVIQFGNLVGMDWPCIKGEGAEESNYIFYMEIFCKIVISVITAIIILKTYSEVNGEINLYEDIISKQCTDNITLNQIIEIKQNLKTVVYNFDLVYLLLFIFTTIFDICIAIYFTVAFYKEKREYQAQIDEDHRIRKEQIERYLQEKTEHKIDQQIELQQQNSLQERSLSNQKQNQILFRKTLPL